MTLTVPEGVPTLGATRLTAVVTLSSLTAPTLVQISAGTSKDLTCFVYADSWNPTATQAKGTKRARLCQTTMRDSLNLATVTAPTLMYTYQPQLADAAAGNEAKLLLQEGSTIYVVERLGLDADVAWAVGQRTLTHHLRLGKQIRSGDRSDQNAEFFITQETEYVVDPVEGVVA